MPRIDHPTLADELATLQPSEEYRIVESHLMATLIGVVGASVSRENVITVEYTDGTRYKFPAPESLLRQPAHEIGGF